MYVVAVHHRVGRHCACYDSLESQALRGLSCNACLTSAHVISTAREAANAKGMLCEVGTMPQLCTEILMLHT